jgi:heme/copper-type cytochrome/quinol oxidase subunit 3
MYAVVASVIVASCVFGGSVLAMYAARALPDSHLGADARDVIKVGMALIATLVALVLGLMIATATVAAERNAVISIM